MVPLRKQYFRTLVLLQLREVDNWLEYANQQGAVSCHTISLYYTTLALLDSKSAVEDNSFGALHIQSGLNVDNGPPQEIVVRQFATLKSLGSLFDTLPPRYILRRNRYERQFVCIFKNQLASLESVSRNFKWETAILRRVGTILESCYETISWEYWDRKPEKNEDQINNGDQRGKKYEYGEEEDKREGGGEQSDNWREPDDGRNTEQYYLDRVGLEEADLREEDPREREKPKEEDQPEENDGRMREIDDAIVWRCILICLLFCTAPDSTEILSSGLWEHVIPII